MTNLVFSAITSPIVEEWDLKNVVQAASVTFVFFLFSFFIDYGRCWTFLAHYSFSFSCFYF